MNPSKILLFVLPVALLAAFGVYFLGGQGDEDRFIEETEVETQGETPQGLESETEVETRETARIVESGSGRQVLEASFDEEREAPEYERALSGITGRILMEEDGKAVPDLPLVIVEIHLDTITPSLGALSGLMPGRKPVFIRGRTQTDAEGRFRFKRLHSRAFHMISIGPGTDKVAFRLLPHGAPVGGNMDLGDIRLQPRGSIEGKLVDEKGQAVAGAKIRAVDIPQIIAGFGIAKVDLKGRVLVHERSTSVIFDLPRWIQVAEEILPFPVTESASDGSFQLRGVPTGQQTVLVLPKRGLAVSKSTRVRAHKVARFRSIKIKPGETLTGSSVDRSGQPVAGVQICSGERLGPSPFSFLGQVVKSDESGTFRLVGAGRRTNNVVYRRNDRSPWIYAGEFRPGDAIRLELPSLGSGKIEVRDSSGKAITKVDFQVGQADEIASIPGFERFVDIRSHLAPVEGMPGQWMLKDLDEGNYRVVARSEGFALVAGLLEIQASHATVLKLTLPTSPSYQFEVVDQNQKPVAGARIYWDIGKSRRLTKTIATRKARLSSPSILLGKTDGQGILEVRHLEVGASCFAVRHPAYALGTSGKDTLGAETHYRFVLTKAASVVGQVKDRRKGKEERLSVMAEPSWKLRRHYGDLMMPRIVATDSEGRFRIDGMTPGEWRFQALPDFFSPTKVSEFFQMAMLAQGMRERSVVQLFAGQETRVEILLGRREKYEGAGILEGMVTMNGRPRKDVLINASSQRGSFQATTDKLGRFRIEGLPESMIRVEATRGDFRNLDRSQLWSGKVDLSKQQSLTLRLDFQTATARIQLMDPRGEILSGIGVRLIGVHEVQGTKSGASRYRGLSDSDGLVRIDEVAVGSYELKLDWTARRRGVVLPTTMIEIRQGGAPIRITSAKALRVSGHVEWVLSHLQPEERRAFDTHAGKRMNDDQVWVRMGGDWSSCSKKSGEWRFQFKGLVPGKNKAQAYRAGLNWNSDDIEVAYDRKDLVLQMKPDTSRIKQWVRLLRIAEKRQKGTRSSSGNK